jgi:hypothetical protein
MERTVFRSLGFMLGAAFGRAEAPAIAVPVELRLVGLSALLTYARSLEMFGDGLMLSHDLVAFSSTAFAELGT